MSLHYEMIHDINVGRMCSILMHDSDNERPTKWPTESIHDLFMISFGSIYRQHVINVTPIVLHNHAANGNVSGHTYVRSIWQQRARDSRVSLSCI